jgi:hypothetical protein
MQELYDKTFIQCIRRNMLTDTDDNYDNHIVLAEARKQDNVNLVYKAELDRLIKRTRLTLALTDLVAKAPLDIANMIHSYLLYLKIMDQCPAEIRAALEGLYLAIRGTMPAPELAACIHHTVDQSLLHLGHANPDTYTFLEQISQLAS